MNGRQAGLVGLDNFPKGSRGTEGLLPEATEGGGGLTCQGQLPLLL